MNETQALDFASENLVVVGVDRVRRIKKDGLWIREFYFNVGIHTVRRLFGESEWSISGGAETFKRGEAIEKCVRLIIEARQDKCE